MNAFPARLRPPIAAIVAALAIAGALGARGAPRWRPAGPDGGGPIVLAADPVDAAILYAAVPVPPYGLDTKLFRSRDGGLSWTGANLGLEGERVISLAIDPAEPARLYAVTAVQGGISDGAGGVYRSDDAGAHWTRVGSPPTPGGLGGSSTLLILPEALLLSTFRGVVRSRDEGETWEPSDPSAPSDVLALQADPRDARIVYAAGWFGRARSRDGGLTWTALNDPPGWRGDAVTAFALAPTAPRTLYEYTFWRGVYRSRDGGDTWKGPSAVPGIGNLETEHLLVDPEDPKTFYLATTAGAFVSRDGGKTIVRLRRGLPELALGSTAFPGVRELIADRRGRILAATSQGIWASTDDGFTWSALPGRGMHQNPVAFLRLDPHDRRHLLVRSFDDVWSSRGGFATFARVPALSNRELAVLEFDPFTPERIVAVTSRALYGSRRLFESRDGGATWQPLGLPPAETSAVAFVNPHVLVAAAGATLQRSRDGGMTWRRTFVGTPTDERGWFIFGRLLVDPLRPNVVYATGRDCYLHAGCPPTLYRSDDGGISWRLWRAGVAVAQPDPSRPGVVYVPSGADLLRTRDDGATFQTIGRVSSGFSALVVEGDGTLVAATGQGVLRSHDDGRTWAVLAPGLPNGGFVLFNDLVHDGDGSFYAAVSGGGLWRVDDP